MGRVVVLPNYKTPEAQAKKAAANHSAAHTGLCGEIVKYLDAVGAWNVRLAGGMYQRPGLPDITGFIKHPELKVPISFFIEVKTGTGKLRKNQQQVRDEIVSCGGIHIEARMVDDVHRRFRAEGLVLVDLLF